MLRWFFIFALILFLSPGVYGQDSIVPSFSFKWKNGFQLKRSDDLFNLKFGGRIMMDYAHFAQDPDLKRNFGVLDNSSRSEITSARLFFSGSLYRNVEFKLQMEFANDKIALKDVYVGITDIPALGTLRLGRFNEPFRLATLTSGKYITFMDRAANTDFSPGRNTGVLLLNDFLNRRLSAQMGVFRNPNNSSVEHLKYDGYALTGRITVLPIKNDDHTRLLHLGIAHSYRKPESKEYEVEVSPGSKLSQKYLKTGVIHNVEHIGLSNFEAAYVHGSLSLQSEYLIAQVNRQPSHYHFSSYYAQLTYFLTGESKLYKSSYKGFGRINPRKNFMGNDKGWGAWEIAAKYSYTDVDTDLAGNTSQSEWILGLNWYLNPATRFMVNYIHSDFRNMGSLNTIQARLQLDF